MKQSSASSSPISISDLYEIYKSYPQVQTDTRQLKKDNLYFALKGPNFNGNEFALQALEQGAAFAIVDEQVNASVHLQERIIYVEDVLSSLQTLAKFHREQFNIPFIAITGSNGKTTTTALLYHICKLVNEDVAMVGNIGFSFARQIAQAPKALYIIEVSSFQLDDIQYFKPEIAILLNITEDHLDRYDHQFENYIKSKFRIIENQTAEDYFIYCIDDETIVKHLELLTINTNPLPFSMKQEVKKGGYIKNEQMMLKIQEERVTMSIYDFALKGKHNAYNTMAASIAATTLGIRKEKIREAVSNFHSLEHRMEFVATVRGVDFINDSKATNVNSTWYALESMQKSTVLILGGVDKGNDYELIADLVKEKVKAIVCMGTDNKKLIEFFKDKVKIIVEVDTAKKAVNASFKLAEKGDLVLMSPACASFDLFKNYEDRGRQFKESVKEL